MTVNIKNNKVEDLARISDRAFTVPERTQAATLWNELNEFINNNNYSTIGGSGNTTSLSSWESGVSSATSPGGKNTNRVFDGTAGRAATTLSSSIHGLLTNPATQWAGLSFSGATESLNEDPQSVTVLQKAERDIMTQIQESNFSDTMLKVYMSYVTLGNSAVFHEIRPDNSYRFTALHMGQVAWAENPDSIVDTVFRKVTMTAKQAIQQWGENTPSFILDKAKTNPLEDVSIMHVIMPRDAENVKLDEQGLALPQFRPFASFYFEVSSAQLIEEGGFYEMPMYATRYHTMPGEIYGRGPGHLAIPDVRTLNVFKKLNIEAETLNVKTPVFVSQKDIWGGQLRIKPGQVTVMKNTDSMRFWESRTRDQTLGITIQDLVQSINESFFLDKLLLPPRTETGEMTAFEISERLKQTQMVLGPVLSRLNNELLEPLILRMFNGMLRTGQIELSPGMVQLGVDLTVVFNNQLMQAQRIQDVSNINQWVQIVGGMAQLNPEVIDNIDFDTAARITGEILRVPVETIKDIQVRDEEREQRAEQAQQQQLMEQAPALADAANKISDI
jgi:hypothetical protein